MGFRGSLSFPAGPVIGQTYDHVGKTYSWNGTGWRQVTPAQLVLPAREQFIALTAAYTLVSQTAAQNLFPGGGVDLLSNWTYFFECVFSLTAMSATSGGFGFALAGTAVLTRQGWEVLGGKAATLATQIVAGTSYNTTANVAVVGANTSTTASAIIRGSLRVGAGGSLMPQVSLGIAAAAIVGIDSFLRVVPVGPDTMQSTET